MNELKNNTRKKSYYMYIVYYVCVISVIIAAILMNIDRYNTKSFNKNSNITSLLTFNVIKKIKEGKCSNTFLIQINEHDYIVIIDKNSYNTIFSHNIDCRFCTNNNLFFYPYSCSVLDGYNSKMMDTYENIKK